MKLKFHNTAFQKRFDEDGFVVLSLLDPDGIRTLTNLYHSINTDHKTPYGFHVSIDIDEPEQVKQIHDEISRVCSSSITSFVEPIKVFSGRFLVKDPNRHSIVTPHQDWTFVDEASSNSAIVWIPLQDVSIRNGAIGLIRGSHLWFDSFRATPLPVFKVPFDEISEDLFPYLEVIEMKAGEAMIMDNRMIHGSSPNLDQTPRIVAGFEITSSENPLVHFSMNRDSTVTEYSIDENFFYEYSNAKLKALYDEDKRIENYTPVRSFEYQDSSVDLKWIMSKMNPEVNPFQDLLKKLFDYSYGKSEENPIEALAGKNTQKPSIFEKIRKLIAE